MYQTMIVKADWISGWAPSIAAIAAASFFRSKRFFIVVLIIGIIAGYQSRDFFEKVANSNVEDGALGRLSLWDQNWRVVREHWMFGTGPAGYALYYMTYYKEDARSTHNNYLDIMAQFGFIGMITWLWLAFTAVVEGVRTIYRAPPGFLKTLAIIATSGWIGAQASMFFGDWILPFAYNQGVGGYKYTVYSWIFLGTIISIQQIMRRQAQPVVQSIQQT
jgi:O-antigen ligase